MASHGFTNLEEAQCVLWTAESHGNTAKQKTFCKKYQKTSLADNKIRRWYKEYQARGGHFHRRGNCFPDISDEKKYRIRSMSNENLTLSLRNIAD